MKKISLKVSDSKTVKCIVKIILFMCLIIAEINGSAQTAYVPNSTDNTVSVINLTTNSVITTIPVGTTPEPVAVSNDGTRVYVANISSNNVSVISTATNTVISTIPLGFSPAGICVSPNGKKLYISNVNNNNVIVYNTLNNTLINTITVGSNPRGIAITPNGKKVYVANSASATISVIDSSTNAVTATIIYSSMPWGLCMHPDGSKLYASNTGSGVAEINTTTNSISYTVTVPAYTDRVAISTSGTRICAISFINNAACIIDPSPIYPLYTATIANGPSGVDLSPDGSKIYVCSNSGNSVSVLSTATYSIITTIPVGNGPAAFGKFISFNQQSGINDVKKDKGGFSIYPNPFAGQTHIVFEQFQHNAEIKILNPAAQLIKSFRFSGNDIILEKGDMKAGIYFLQLTDEKQMISYKKIVIE